VYELNQECTITPLLNKTNSALPVHVSLTVVRMDSWSCPECQLYF